MSMDLFITAAGTEIGKTFVAETIIRECFARGISCDAIKPVITGFDESAHTDTARLLGALEIPLTPAAVEACSPWRFAEALSPNMAAGHEGRRIALSDVVEFCRRPCEARLRLIEGIGGVMVPLNEAETTLDWMALLGAPAILVCGSYLGAISHALTALVSLQSRSVPVAGIVVSQSPDEPVPLEETLTTLQRFGGAIPIVALARDGTVTGDQRDYESLLEALLLVPAGG